MTEKERKMMCYCIADYEKHPNQWHLTKPYEYFWQAGVAYQKALADTEDTVNIGGKKKEDKFIVINTKRFKELKALGDPGELAVAKLGSALASFEDDYMKYTGNSLSQKYITCNQDEPYAEKVWDLILGRQRDIKDTGVWNQYQKSSVQEMRRYILGETLSKRVSISKSDKEDGSPKIGDMIARNSEDHDDQWLIAADFFSENYEPVRLTTLSPSKESEERCNYWVDADGCWNTGCGAESFKINPDLTEEERCGECKRAIKIISPPKEQDDEAIVESILDELFPRGRNDAGVDHSRENSSRRAIKKTIERMST